MNKDKTVYEEIIVNGKKELIVKELDKKEIETNNTKCFLDNTIELKEIVKEIKENELY